MAKDDRKNPARRERLNKEWPFIVHVYPCWPIEEIPSANMRSDASAKSMQPSATRRCPIDGGADVCDVGPPDKWMTMFVPIGCGGFDRLLHFRPSLEAAAFERERAQDFPPRLDEIEIRGILRLEDELPPRMLQAE